jgi:hypothetical protein
MVAFGSLWLKTQKKYLPASHLDINTTAVPNTYYIKDLHKQKALYNISRVSKSKLDKETVQKAMIRTCNAVYQKGLLNHCPNAESVDTTWAFARDMGNTGRLITVWNGSRTSAFSCGSESSYGRYLLHHTLTSDLVKQYGNYSIIKNPTNAIKLSYKNRLSPYSHPEIMLPKNAASP